MFGAAFTEPRSAQSPPVSFSYVDRVVPAGDSPGPSRISPVASMRSLVVPRHSARAQRKIGEGRDGEVFGVYWRGAGELQAVASRGPRAGAERKVRAPTGSRLANGEARRRDGKCNRE